MRSSLYTHVCWECLAITVPTITFSMRTIYYYYYYVADSQHNSRNLKAACIYILELLVYMCAVAALSLDSPIFNKEVIIYIFFLYIATRPWLSQFKPESTRLL